MAQKKVDLLTDESLVDFICRRAESDFIELTPERLKSVLRKHFVGLVDHLATTENYKRHNLTIRLTRMESVKVPKLERKYWVMSMFSSAYMYTIRCAFNNDYKGTFVLRPNKDHLNKLIRIVDSSPDMKLRYYGKKTT